jgi:hypothetical protein
LASKRSTPNVQRPTPNFWQLEIGNWQSMKMPGGRFELPSSPESFRGCSTAANGKLRVSDSSFALMNAQFRELHRGSALLSLQQFKRISKSFRSRSVAAQMLFKPCIESDS